MSENQSNQNPSWIAPKKVKNEKKQRIILRKNCHQITKDLTISHDRQGSISFQLLKTFPESIVRCLNHKEWYGALNYLEALLRNIDNGIDNVRQLVFLLWRSECCYKLAYHESCVEDCRKIMRHVSKEGPGNNFWVKSRWLLIHSLIELDKLKEATPIIQELANVCDNFIKHECMKLLKEIGQETSPSKSKKTTNVSQPLLCIFCNLRFKDKNELGSHYLTKDHHQAVVSDEGKNWKKRPPPRKLTTTNYGYNLCPAFIHNESAECSFGSRCKNAHGIEEFYEWRERSEYRMMKLLVEKALPYRKSYAELFLKRLSETTDQEMMMKESLEGVDVEVEGELTSVHHAAKCHKKWIFKIHTPRILRAVILLHDSHRDSFLLGRITATMARNGKMRKLIDEEPVNAQEWNSQFDDEHDNEPLSYIVEVDFHSNSFGSYSQSILFDFGQEPVLMKQLRVDVVQDKQIIKMNEIQKVSRKIELLLRERWTNSNALIIPFLTTTEIEETSSKYCVPTEPSFLNTQSIIDDHITVNNYRSRMHCLLYIEEMAYYEQITKFNTPTSTQIVNSLPKISDADVEKFSTNGELVAIMHFDKDISEDNPAGRLLLKNCGTVLLGDAKKISKKKIKNRNPNVYEAVIEYVSKNVVYLRLSAKTVANLKLKPEGEGICNEKLEIQFQLNRSKFCKFHQAIDEILDLAIIFPDLKQDIKLPNINETKWMKSDSKLNDKQKEAIAAVTLPRNTRLPPVLILGPSGTGKTYALVQAIKHILLEEDTKILICTHSNSAADVYIEEYLHRLVTSGVKEATPLRIYHREHRVPTVSNTVLKYCLIETQNDTKTFKIPASEDILTHRIIVSTINATSYLSNIDLPTGHFTHILIDEATQILECETIIPLVLADEKTRIALAGDLTRPRPEVLSSFAKQKGFHVPLLQRLYKSYPTTYPKIILSEIYSAVTSEDVKNEPQNTDDQRKIAANNPLQLPDTSQARIGPPLEFQSFQRIAYHPNSNPSLPRTSPGTPRSTMVLPLPQFQRNSMVYPAYYTNVPYAGVGGLPSGTTYYQYPVTPRHSLYTNSTGAVNRVSHRSTPLPSARYMRPN